MKKNHWVLWAGSARFVSHWPTDDGLDLETETELVRSGELDTLPATLLHYLGDQAACQSILDELAAADDGRIFRLFPLQEREFRPWDWVEICYCNCDEPDDH